MICEPCLKSWDAASNPLPLGVVITAATPMHHTNRKCPVCRTLLVGPGYKCYGLRSLARGTLGKEEAAEYDSDSKERQALIDLRLKYLKQVELGSFAAQQFAMLLTHGQQIEGVLVFFHPTSTHAFLQSFGTYLVRVHQYDVQYDIAGRVMTVRILLGATVIVRQPLGSDRVAPQFTVHSSPPVRNNADLWRFGVQLMPDRYMCVLYYHTLVVI